MSANTTVVIDTAASMGDVAAKIAELLQVTPIEGLSFRGDPDGSVAFEGLNPMAWLDDADYIDEPGLPGLSTYRFGVTSKSVDTPKHIYRALVEGTDWRVALITDNPPRYLAVREPVPASA